MHESQQASTPPRLAIIAPGRDMCGITDYSFWIAAAAARGGATVRMVLFREKASPTHLQRVSTAGPGRVEVIDPGRGRASPEEIVRAVGEFRPDLVSLQFSPSDFRVGRSIHRPLAGLCARLRPFKVLLMVHETWTQSHLPATARNRAVAFLRRLEILLAWRKLRQPVVFASNPGHVRQLARAGLRPSRLPIFSNIPGGPRPGAPADIRSVLESLAEPPRGVDRLPERPLIALFFARIPPEFDPRPFLACFRAEASSQGRAPVLLSVGATGYGGTGLRRLAETAGELPLLTLGHRAEPEITRLLHAADWGVSPTPFAFWEKSSSCAAMVAHGLPVVFSQRSVPDEVALPFRFGLLGHPALAWREAPPGRIASFASPSEIWERMRVHHQRTT